MANVYRIADLLSGNRDKTIPELLDWQNSIFDEVLKLNPREAGRLKYLGHVPVYMLPLKQQVEAVASYRRIIGLDTILNQVAGEGTRDEQIDNVFQRLTTVKPRTDKSPFVRLSIEGNDELSNYYKGLNLQFLERPDMRKSGLLNPEKYGRTSSHFGIGLTSMPRIRGPMPTSMMPGASFTTFDIETASLTERQIREVSYHSGIVGPGGELGKLDRGEALFRPRMFARGSMGMADEEGRVVPLSLEEFMQKRHGMKLLDKPTENLGADFAERMTPFLNRLKQSDHIIGHNILSFDIPQVFTALYGTKKYGQDKEFRELVDTTHEHVIKNSIDTLVLARQAPNLANLQIADELSAHGSGSTYSIENLLLQTDLSERIGHDNLQALMGEKGLHFGEVDDIVTLNLYKHLGELQQKTLGGSGITDALRRQIISSAAITPFTNIRKQSEIADQALKTLIDVRGGISVPAEHAELANLLESAQAGNQNAKQAAFDMIRNGEINGLRFNINPIEHQALSTRRLGLAANVTTDISTDNLIFNNNIFERVVVGRQDPERNEARGILNHRRITDAQMTAVQDELARHNMPWAGLSFEERSIGTTLHHLTSSVDPTAFGQELRNLTSDTLVSRFEQFNPSTVGYITKSGRPSLPASLLEDFGALRPDSGALLRLSSVEPSIWAKEARVNLVYDFGEGQAEKFGEHLKKLAASPDHVRIARALGIDVDKYTEMDHIDIVGPVARFKEAVQQRGLIANLKYGDKGGVSIGQLQPKEAFGVIEALKNFSSTSRLADDAGIEFALPYMGMNGNVVETSGAILTRHLKDADRADISMNVKRTRQVLGNYAEMTKSENKFKLGIAQADARMGGDRVSPALKELYEGYQGFRQHAPALAGAVIGLGLLHHFIKRHAENEQYNDPIERQPVDPTQGQYGVAEQLQMRKDSGIDRSYQRYDPLATAYVVNNLDNNKINHSLMGNQKNNVLYGGVL